MSDQSTFIWGDLEADPAVMFELMRQVAALTAERNALQAQLDAVNAVTVDEIDIITRFYTEVCEEAERTISTTGMVSGAHWNAMRVLLQRRGIKP